VNVPGRDYEIHLVEELRAGRLTRRELIQRASVAGLSATGVASLLAAAGATARASTPRLVHAPKRGGSATIGFIAPGTDADPVTAFSAGAGLTYEISLEYLLYPRPDFTLEPKLATSWHSGKTTQDWTFVLRKGVTWHDGSPFTADDVVATFDLFTNPKGSATDLSNLQGILSHGNTEKVDSHTVRFHLDLPYTDFPFLISAFTNSVILPKNYQPGSFTKGHVGTGPFILTSFQPGSGASFVRNPHYWNKGRPYLDSLSVKFYADNTPLVLALQSGEIDVIPNTASEGSQALFSDANIVKLQTGSSAYRELHMRVDQAPFKDPRVRQALALAIDRPALIKTVLGGRGDVGNDHPFAPVFPISKTILSRIPQREANVAAAKKLLAQAGHPHGFRATLTTEQFLEIPDYAVFLKQAAASIGVDLNLNIEPQNTYYGSGANQPWLKVPLGIVDWGSRGVPSELITPAFTCKGIWNSAHWCNPAYTHLIAQFAGQSDEQKRAKLALQAAKLQQEATPAIIAYWNKELRTTRKNVHGLAAGPASHLDVSGLWVA
jgi:peptide/nickel transport system substrate-binding protein